MLGLRGKTAVVFGVASEDSIAWAICQQLAEAGADLFLGYQKRFMSRVFQLKDKLPAIKQPFEILSAHHMMHRKHQHITGATESYVSFTVRDANTGVGVANPCHTRSRKSNYTDFRRFVGLRAARPSIIVK